MKIIFKDMLLLLVTTFVVSALSLVGQLSSGDALPRVESDFSKAAPRAVEELTQRSVARDYGFAWERLDSALSSNSAGLLDAYFVGPAKAGLAGAIASQAKSGMQTRYLKQNHKLEAVFYSPEGDVMELHDTAQCDLQLVADGKTIQDEHVVLRFVVLMTPAADRWVVRQLQAVPQF
jgi:hypothetical protein